MDGHHDQYDHKPMSMVMIMITRHQVLFLLTNAIILVVAADSGAFSSSDKVTKQDVYEEVLINNKAASCRPPSPIDSHVHKVGKELALISSPSDSEQSIKENNNELVLVGDGHCHDVHQDQISVRNVSIEKVVTVLPSSNDQEKTIISSSPNNILRRSKTEKLRTTPMEYLESCEDMSIVPVSDHPESRSLRRSKTENLKNKGPEESEEGCDEFSAMSVEELNKRVEEFINKFNREIRLQETELLV
ncbi:hypothetical protein Sjap_026368 [Stephania japonica]|uniref:Uncharacterized protein n=1 Tax=Stephania japonica TaxID=461633 RepID=A0AAP0E6W0_9MAGN